MKTATVVSVRMSVLLLLLLQTVPVRAMNAGMAYALPEAKAGAAYEYTIRTEGGQPPFKWSVVEGNLPPGIELDQSGVLRGIPTAPRSQVYEFTLQVSDSSEPPRTSTQRFALGVTPASLKIVLSEQSQQTAQRFTGKDAWKNKYVKQHNEIMMLRGDIATSKIPHSAVSLSNAETQRADRQTTAEQKQPKVSEFELQPPSSDQARAQHKSDQDLVKEFVRSQVTVLAPKNASDIFGRRIARRYVAFLVTVGNENKDYRFLIQNLSLDLSDVAPDLESVRIPDHYRPSSNTISLLRGVSEKGQVYDWRNLSLRLMEGTGTIASSLGNGVIGVGRAYAPGVSTFNGPLTNAFRLVFPDMTVTQANRLNDNAYQTNTLIPPKESRAMVAFLDMSMLLLDRELRNRFYKDPLSIADIIDFRRAKAEVSGILITDVLDQPPLISAVVIRDDQKAHFSDKPAKFEGTIVGRNLTGSSVRIDNKGMTIEVKGTPESNRINFEVKSDEPILPGTVLTFAVVRKDDVAKQDFPVSYMIAIPTLDKISPDTLKRGDSDKEITLTGKNFSKGLFRVTGCDGIKVKESTWQSETEIKIKIDVLADAERGPCQLRVKNGDNFVSGPQTLTIQKAKPEEKGQEN